jgi:hypothetical protein
MLAAVSHNSLLLPTRLRDTHSYAVQVKAATAKSSSKNSPWKWKPAAL